jgi:Tol biopolymer transport system component
MRTHLFAVIRCGTVAILAAYSFALPTSAQQAATSAASLPTPEIFAPGVISGPANDGAPTFSPDGNTLLYTQSAAHWSIILESHRKAGVWSHPTVASFSGEWPDSSPAFSPDGSYVIFVSVHRVLASGNVAQHAESHIWRVDRKTDGWSAPVELPAAVNSFEQVFRPSVAADGTVYFTAANGEKNLSLFRSQYKNGAFLKAEPLSFSNGSVKDVDPEIAPDQSFLIFSSKRPFPGDETHEHLFLVRAKDEQWGAIEPIRYAGDVANGSSEDNDPRLGPDHRSIYFSSDRSGAVHFPRAHAKAVEDFQRLEKWDNSNSNIWMIPLNI